MRHGLKAALVLGLALAAAPLPAASGWEILKSDRFGFAMLVAPGMRWEVKEFGHGWGGMRASKDLLEIRAIANMGDFSDASVIEAAAVELTGVPAPSWKLEDQGQNANGWRWWKTYKVRLLDKGRVLYCIVGHGPRGSYLFGLETDESEFEAHKSLYLEWYHSLSVY
jgi:hypothetical protein